MSKYKTSKLLDETISKIWLKVRAKEDNTFYIYFDTEFDRDKYIRRSNRFTNIKIVDYDDIYKFNYGI